MFDVKNVRQDSPAKGQILVYWLCGAGYVFKFSDGQILCVDPYLSDSCERLTDGLFRRISLAPLTPEELHFDLLLLTHDHGDHLDEDSFDGFLKANSRCRILAAECCAEFLAGKKASHEIVKPGDVSTAGEISVETVHADHGEICPTAVGFVIRASGRSIYLTGDTGYTQAIVDQAVAIQPKILVACINGAYGNLDEKQAATLAAKCGAKMVIPDHFGLFIPHGGCPRRFSEHLKQISPQAEVVTLTPGRGALV